jgi:energy-coupling factor transporter transmembrane protein EcfT
VSAGLAARLAALVGLLAAAMVADLVGLALLLCAAEGLLLASGRGRGQGPVLAAAAFAAPFALLNGALYGAIPVAGLPLFREGLEAGAAFGLRTVIAVAGGLWVLRTARPREALALLHRWPRAALAVAGALRFAPLAARDWARVREAHALRSPAGGKGLRGTLAAAPLLVPLTVATVRRGAALQDAIEASAFGSGPRTRWPRAALDQADLALAGMGAALLALAAWRLLRGVP